MSLYRPTATYRLQLRGGFTFADAAAQVPYLAALGVSHVYLSPVLQARPGSTHGYDVVNHAVLNPELGGMAGFEALVRALQDHGLGQVWDIVPNHMGVMGDDNPWWLSVLENGPASPWADFFDIDWHPLKRELHGKVLLPTLGGPYGETLARGELTLRFDAGAGAFSLCYFQHRFPLDPSTYPRILHADLDALRQRLGSQNPDLLEFERLIAAFGHLPERSRSEAEALRERERDKELHKRALAALVARSPALATHIAHQVATINARCRDWTADDGLHGLLERQPWRLAFWRVAADEINYRRFFDINELAGLRMERPEVFEATHRLILEQVRLGRVHGLRIDHPDGLYDPAAYFARLAEATAVALGQPVGTEPPVYVAVEKILADHESLRADWRVHGTTGYEFIRLMNGVQIDGNGLAALRQCFADFTGRTEPLGETIHTAKRTIMRTTLASELNVLANRLGRLAEADPVTRDFTVNALRSALAEVVAAFPVYRTYVDGRGAQDEDRRDLDWAVAQAKKRHARGETTIFDFIHRVLALDTAADTPALRRLALQDFAMRFAQYTGPVMAKSVEDTTFYRSFALASLNEVGSNPARAEVSVAALHHHNQRRLQQFAHQMLAGTTHDTKRSEDVRARLNVLSECPQAFGEAVQRWARMNRRHLTEADGERLPAAHHEYLLYQTLIGSWPADAAAIAPDYADRIVAYLQKATREGKEQSSWFSPDAGYETALERFVRGVLEPGPTNPFPDDLARFVAPLVPFGRWNGLAQSLLQATAPGFPDLYQGTELETLSLVDPDNRRPVDYAKRSDLLARLREAPDPAASWQAAWENRTDGALKLHLVHAALAWRQADPALFQQGSYLPLTVSGPASEHLCVFARQFEGRALVVLAPRLLYTLCQGDLDRLTGARWADTRLQADPGLPSGPWTDVLTGTQWAEVGADLGAGLAGAPLALLRPG